MTSHEQDVFARAYATLTSIRQNISHMGEYNSVGEVFVQEYLATLDKLSGLGFDLAEYRIEDSLVRPRVVIASSSGTFGHSRTSYSDAKYVQKSVLLMKLDAVLSYFEIITGEQPRRIGFRQQ